jgi:hypothetical protein
MIWMRPISAARAPPLTNFRFACNLHNHPGRPTKDQEKVMANLKDIVATLAILSAGTLTLTGCKKEGGETTNPDEVTDGAGEGEGDAEADAEASCEGEGDVEADAEASCEGEGDAEAPAEGEGEAEAEAPAE